VTPGWLDRLIAAAERKAEIGIAGPRSNYVSGCQRVKEIDYHADSLEGLVRFARAFAERHAGQGERVLRCGGFCMLIKRDVVEKIGGFDEVFGLGNFEDDDFCLRAALAGFEAWVVHDCFVHHFGNRTFWGAGIDFNESLKQNWELFKKKWGIPAAVAYGESYDLSRLFKGAFIPEKHYDPLNPPRNLSKEGEELFAAGDLEGAQKIFEEILTANPDEPEALNNLGVVASHQNHPDLAANYFNRALSVDPTHTEAMANLGSCLMTQKDYTRATRWLRKALDGNPDDVGILNDLANCFVQLEDFAEAEKIYRRSHHLDGNQSPVGEILVVLDKMKALGLSGRKANENI
jgi:tetratricopeptide (TPR) repeat protein